MRYAVQVALTACLATVGGCGEAEPAAPSVPPNTLPTAAFSVVCTDLTCVLTDASTDADGTIASHAWEFGDSGTSTDQHPTHTYAEPGGEFTVRLTVTDDRDGVGAAAWPVNVRVGNAAPIADFVGVCVNITCSFTDQSTDTDAGDSVVSRAWEFGDGMTSGEQHPTHIYPVAGGQFTVRLTVADVLGAEATTERAVDAAWADTPDRSGTYTRETPHHDPGRHSSIVIRADGTFELRDSTVGGVTVYPGRWEIPVQWSGIPVQPGTTYILDFEAFDLIGPFSCGEGFASFFFDTHVALAYCGVLLQAGLEEGFYSSVPRSDPGFPPPQSGELAFVRDGQIYRVNTDGGGLVQLSAGPGDWSPAWSPDGDRIAFFRSEGALPGLYVMEADGSSVVQLGAGDASSRYRDPAPTWSPDGDWIAFNCSEAQARLCKVNASGDPATLGVIFEQPGQLSYPSWSPDGTRIAHGADWALWDTWFDIFVVTPDGLQLTPLITHTTAAPNPYQFYQPAWSPDGSRLAFVTCPWSGFSCSSSLVSVMNADGSGMAWLATTSGSARPTWSPDGQVIAFASSNALEWVSADGSQRGRIIDNGEMPAWRP